MDQEEFQTRVAQAEVEILRVAFKENKALMQVLAQAVEHGKALLAGACLQHLERSLAITNATIDKWAVYQPETADMANNIMALHDDVDHATFMKLADEYMNERTTQAIDDLVAALDEFAPGLNDEKTAALQQLARAALDLMTEANVNDPEAIEEAQEILKGLGLI